MVNMEQRSSSRIREDALSVEIPLSIPLGEKIVKPIHDISENGLSFFIPSDEGYFYEDTILKNVKIFNNEYEEFIPASKVLYCNREKNGESERYKIGLNFLSSKEQSANRRKREKRFSSDFIGNIKSYIVFSNEKNGDENTIRLSNFSKYGVAFTIKKATFIIRKSEVIKALKILADDTIVYQGDGLVVDIDEKGDKTTVRIHLLNTALQFENITNLRLGTKIEYEKSKVLSLLDANRMIGTEFKNNVSDISYFLQHLKEMLDKFEREIQGDHLENRQKLTKNMLSMLEETLYPKFDVYTAHLDAITEGIKGYEHEIHKEYFQKVLHPFLMLAPLLHRIYTKPLGIPGDFEMMNMISRNQHEGSTLFGQLLHKYICYKPASMANRNRTTYLYTSIKNILHNLPLSKKKTKITSIACGSAIEIQKFIHDEKISDNTEITLLDFCKEALAYTNQKLESLITEHKRQTKVTFIQETIYNLIRDKESRKRIIDAQDIIYSIGLFEYLTNSTCKFLIKVLYEKLSPGGILIIGNYAKGTPLKSWMELGVEWYLIYRSEAELLALANNISEKSEAYIEQEPLGIIKFLIIKK